MRKLILLSLLAFTAAAAASLSVNHVDARQTPGRPVERSLSKPPAPPPNGVLVRFRPGAPALAARALVAASGAHTLKRQARSGLVRLSVPAGVSVDEFVAALRRSPLVAEAGPNLAVTADARPDDTYYPYQWDLRSTDGGMWADTAWDLAPNHGRGVTVAVIDTGVAYEAYNGSLNGSPQTFAQAPDLASKTFVAPWDFNNADAHANDDNGHGTHVTGTIAEDTNNGYDMAGVAYEATIMPVKVLDYTGNGNDDDLVEAIYYAVDNGARVINMSLGYPGTGAPDAGGTPCTEIVGLNAALDYAYSHGVVVVAASGNDGATTVTCPAAYPTVIAVGATRFDGQVTWYSNRGAALDIAAPGGDPYVDQNGDGLPDAILQESFCDDASLLLQNNTYGDFCPVLDAGTSMATPHVTGTVALLLGENPSLTPDELRALLQGSAREGGAAGWDSSYGWGLLDAAGALAAMLGIPKPPPAPVPGLNAPSNLAATTLSSSKIRLTWTDNATSESGFQVESSTDGVNFSLIAVVGANVVTYTSSYLAAGTTYAFRIRAYNGPDVSAYSNTASATTQSAPAAPTNLVATTLSSSKIKLTWTDNATNEAGFYIERSTNGTTFSLVAMAAANATSYTNSSLPAATTYTYRVRAYEGSNYSAYSNTASATTQAAPAAPTGLTATVLSSSQVRLNWTDNATNETGFVIERSTDGASFSLAGTAPANATAYTSMNLAAGTTYFFRLRAYEGANYSDYSNTASATTQGAPAAPTNLAATTLSSSKIKLTWTDNATNEAGFRVERSVDGVNYKLVALPGVNATSYTDANLPPGTTYSYRVQAYNGPNYSAYSNVASATTQPAPAAPTNLVATTLSSNKIKLTWTDNATNEAGFLVEQSADGVTFSLRMSVPANATIYTDFSLSAGTTYSYRIRAYDGPNYSAYSNVASATTQPAPAAPSNLAAVAVSSTRVNLTWTDNATNESGFYIERSADGVNFVLVGMTGANATGWANYSLTAYTTYYYRVRAYDGPNYSAYSSVVSVTTPH